MWYSMHGAPVENLQTRIKLVPGTPAPGHGRGAAGALLSMANPAAAFVSPASAASKG